MKYAFKNVEKYRGYWIIKDVVSGNYKIEDYALRLTSVEVAKKIIDLHIKNKDEKRFYTNRD